jgi:Flp pilus assembly protein CpaB
LNRRVRIGITLALSGIVVVALGFILLSSLIRRTLYTAPAAPQEQPITQKVVIASRDLAVGAYLEEADLALLDVPVEMAPRNAFQEVDTVVNRIVKYPMIQGEMVLSHQLADPDIVHHDLAFEMDEDMVMMAVPSTDLMSRLAVIERGDIVDLFISLSVPVKANPDQLPAEADETTELTRLFTFDSFEKVNVTAVVADVVTQETEDGGQTQQTSVKAYLLAMDPQDALVLKHLIDLGAKFDIVLRNPTSEILFELSPVMQEYILDRYQLEVLPTETP